MQHADRPRCARKSAYAVLWLTLCAMVAAGCTDREERLRAEARVFLNLYEATDHRAPIAERERKIEQLEQLSLADEAVRKARDECVDAHRALIRAERENEQASRALDQALSAAPQGEPLAPADTERIRARITGAEAALSDSRSRFERCESQARGLAMRFGKR